MRKRKKSRRLVSKTLVLLASLGIATAGTYVANASPVPDERYFPFGMSTTEFTIQPFSADVDPAWNVALDNAVEEWNDSHPSISITVDPASLNTVGFDSELPRRALYSKICIPFVCKFHIAIREDGSESGAEWILEEGQFLIVHELGHALGLNDVYDTESGAMSVMSAKKNFGIAKPSVYDMSLLMSRISYEKNQETMIASSEFTSFFTPIWRAFNGYR